MNNPLLARQLKEHPNMRCHFDNILIPVNKPAYQITGGEDIKAQGIYHGRQCYESALKHYEEVEKEMENNE